MGRKDRKKKQQQSQSKPKTRESFVPVLTKEVYGWFLVLALFVVGIYAVTLGHDFTNFDDDVYVTKNTQVQAGLTSDGIKWAMTTGYGSNWFPLTWMSLMLDATLFGLEPGGYHLTNILLHLINTLLLCWIVYMMTGRLVCSVVVAALFAVHPQHVESVAWVTERKDVLSTLFWLLTTWAYIKYVSLGKGLWYGLSLMFMALGLMSKPMLVTLPCVLLLLDFWPLGRCTFSQEGVLLPARKTLPALVWEKVPFFLLVIISSSVTFLVQDRGGAVGSLEKFPLDVRVTNAFWAYTLYLVKTIWPSHLAFFYPHPEGGLAGWKPLVGLLLLIGGTGAAVWWRNKRPYFTTGWFWYVGTLVPVIGLVQVGEQSRADRYTYVPLIGIFILVVWWIDQVIRSRPGWKKPVGAVVALLLVGFSYQSFVQAKTWKNSQTLAERGLAVTKNNYKAHNNIAAIYEKAGEMEKAETHYRTALRIKPTHDHHYNLGNVLRKTGRIDEALAQYTKSLDYHLGFASAMNNMALIYYERKEFEQAKQWFLEGLKYKPNNAEVHNNLGAVYQNQGNLPDAIKHFREAVRMNPGWQGAKDNLARAERLLSAK